MKGRLFQITRQNSARFYCDELGITIESIQDLSKSPEVYDIKQIFLKRDQICRINSKGLRRISSKYY